MSRADNKQLVRRFVTEFKNKANVDIVDELFTPDFVHHLPDPRIPPGREGTKALGRMVFAAFSDVEATIEDLLAEGDRVVERTVARAKHTATFMGAPPTGRDVRWTEIHIYRIEDGMIAEHWPEINMLGLLMQVGAVPAQ